MDLTSPTAIKALLEKYQTKPSKTMGQNFLIDTSALGKIIEAAELKETDTVLEIGPGIGTLTQALAAKAEKVIAIEKDWAMANILKETLADIKNTTVISGDILKTKLELPKTYKLIANLPYYITSPIIRMFLETEHQPEFMVLMVQKEVAQRICAKPDNMSILAVSVQFYAKPEIISYVSKGCFWPVPNVDSAILKITPVKGKYPVNPETFFTTVKAGFSQPRKQLASNLSKGLKKDKKEIQEWLLKNNIQPTQRAETLSVEDWAKLVEKPPK